MPIAGQEAVPVTPEQDEDAKPIPVDDSIFSPPIDVRNLVPLEPDEEPKAKPPPEVPSWHVPPPVRNPNTMRIQSRPAEETSPQSAVPVEQPPRPRRSKSTPKTQ